MRRVHQFLECAVPNDAVTTTALVAKDLLRQFDPTTRIWVNAHDRSFEGTVLPYGYYDVVSDPSDLCVYHLSCDSPLTTWLRRRGEMLAVFYHNITPGAFFARYDPDFARRMDAARHQAQELASRCSAAFAASRYSAEELVSWGYPKPRVVGAFGEASVAEVVPNARALKSLSQEKGRGPAILFVGRITPNKAQHKLVQAVAMLRKKYPDAKLWLVGGGHLPAYTHLVKRLAADLGLGRVFAGAVRTEVLAAYYSSADLFCCVSEHEGFGVPLVEAMRFGLPIVAYACTAVSETAGDAALLLDDNEPSTVAAAIEALWEDECLGQRLVDAGARRLAELPKLTDLEAALEDTVRALA